MGFWVFLLHIVLGLFCALFIGSLCEYVVHRLMHARLFLYKIHAQHHQQGQGQGWLWEFKDYYLPGLPITIIGGLLFYSFVSAPASISFIVGVLLYAAAAAYAHQVQHENPDLVFWLPRPVHHLHHHGKMWHHNFGILVDIWDRVFGTYKPVKYERAVIRPRLIEYLKIKWF